MTFQDFLTEYNGQSDVGTTTENTGQCVGLVEKWINALNLPTVWGNACDLFANADEKFFNKILNTPDAIPQTGDIVVWSKAFNNSFGHTGISTGTGDINSFEAFEQNDPLLSNCHLKTYNYNSVIGWLRPITQSSVDNTIQSQSDAFVAVATKLNLPLNKDVVLGELDKLVGYEDAVVQKDQQINQYQDQIKQLQTQATQIQTQLQGLQDDNAKLNTQVQEQQKTIDNYGQEIQSLSSQLQSLQQATQIPVLSGWKRRLYDFIIWLVKQEI